jgi:hypothetical protein
MQELNDLLHLPQTTCFHDFLFILLKILNEYLIFFVKYNRKSLLQEIEDKSKIG